MSKFSDGDADIECSSENDEDKFAHRARHANPMIKMTSNQYKGTYFFLEDNNINQQIPEVTSENDDSDYDDVSDLSVIQNEGNP